MVPLIINRSMVERVAIFKYLSIRIPWNTEEFVLLHHLEDLDREHHYLVWKYDCISILPKDIYTRHCTNKDSGESLRVPATRIMAFSGCHNQDEGSRITRPALRVSAIHKWRHCLRLHHKNTFLTYLLRIIIIAKQQVPAFFPHLFRIRQHKIISITEPNLRSTDCTDMQFCSFLAYWLFWLHRYLWLHEITTYWNRKKLCYTSKKSFDAFKSIQSEK